MKNFFPKILFLNLISLVYGFAHSVRKFSWRLFKIKTQGVRVIFQKDGKVLLVRHWYNNLWVLPGGRVGPRQNVVQSAQREMAEEIHFSNIIFDKILGVYENTKDGRNDVVTILVARDWKEKDGHSMIEIRDLQWFPMENLPENASRATKDRIQELMKNMSNIKGKW